MLQVVFERTTKYGVFRDALYLPVAHTFTEAEIEAMMQERVDNWIAVIETPPDIETPPEE